MLLHMGQLDWENGRPGKREEGREDAGYILELRLMHGGRYQELAVNLTFSPTSYGQDHLCGEGRRSNRVKPLISSRWFLNKLQYPDILCTVGFLPPCF